MSGDRELELVALDGTVPTPPGEHTVAGTFEPPPEAPLELEPLPPRPPGIVHVPLPPKRNTAGVIVFVAAVAIVLAAAGGALAWLHAHPSAPGIAAGHGVSIKIVAPGQTTAVAIDGHAAGTAPLTLSRPSSTKPLTISAVIDNSDVVVTVVPDHDQVVELRP